MEKEKLIHLLSSLNGTSVITAQFSFDKPYKSVYQGNIVGINFQIDDSGSLSAVICIRETPKQSVA